MSFHHCFDGKSFHLALGVIHLVAHQEYQRVVLVLVLRLRQPVLLDALSPLSITSKL